ncbi:uncharacterized protein TNCV_772701 [Trichonephila clavipes]|nr:uncharacterized protein TNCV_772701 [Trichonephila clavipes]
MSKINQNVSRVKNLLDSDSRRSIRMIADELRFPQTQVFEIVTGTLTMRSVFRVVEHFVQHNVATLHHPPYSPNLAPPDFFLFPRIKSTLKGKHHGSVEAVQQAVTSELNSIPVQAFQTGKLVVSST